MGDEFCRCLIAKSNELCYFLPINSIGQISSMKFVHISGFLEIPDDQVGKAIDALFDTLDGMAEKHGWGFFGGAHEDFMRNDDIICPVENQDYTVH